MKTIISFILALTFILLVHVYFTPQNTNATLAPNSDFKFCYITGYALGYTSASLYHNGNFWMSTEINPGNGYFMFGIDVGCYTPFTVVVTVNDCYATLNNVIGANCPISFKNVPSDCQ